MAKDSDLLMDLSERGAGLPPDHPGPEGIECGRRELTEERILAWAEAHYGAHGVWPEVSAGSRFDPEEEAPGESWTAIDQALARGLRGLPGDSSLAELLAEHRGVHSPPDVRRLALAEKLWALEQEQFPVTGLRRQRGKAARLPRLTFAEILAWADAHHAVTGAWPRNDSGPVRLTPLRRDLTRPSASHCTRASRGLPKSTLPRSAGRTPRRQAAPDRRANPGLGRRLSRGSRPLAPFISQARRGGARRDLERDRPPPVTKGVSRPARGNDTRPPPDRASRPGDQPSTPGADRGTDSDLGRRAPCSHRSLAERHDRRRRAGAGRDLAEDPSVTAPGVSRSDEGNIAGPPPGPAPRQPGSEQHAPMKRRSSLHLGPLAPRNPTASCAASSTRIPAKHQRGEYRVIMRPTSVQD